MKEFSLYQKGIFVLLNNGKPPAISREEFFYNAITEETGKIAESHGCSVEINNKRLFEAQDLWTWDMMSMSRTGKIDGPPSTVPCEFKHAAFLSYWLRRRLFIKHVRKHARPVCGKEKADFFADFASELTAFLIGIRLCAYHANKKTARASKGNIISMKNLQRLIDWEISREYATLLKHKNVSPHALYLAYKSLLHVADE